MESLCNSNSQSWLYCSRILSVYVIWSVVGTRCRYFSSVLEVNLMCIQGYEYCYEFKHNVRDSSHILGQVLCSCLCMYVSFSVPMHVFFPLRLLGQEWGEGILRGKFYNSWILELAEFGNAPVFQIIKYNLDDYLILPYPKFITHKKFIKVGPYKFVMIIKWVNVCIVSL